MARFPRPDLTGNPGTMAPEQPQDREADDLEQQQRVKDDEVLEREGLETELMEHDESEAGEDIHHAG